MHSQLSAQRSTVLGCDPSPYGVAGCCCCCLAGSHHMASPALTSVMWRADNVAVHGVLWCGVLACAMQVHGPFQMLNIIHFLVFRVTRSVLYSLECVLAGSPAKTVS